MDDDVEEVVVSVVDVVMTGRGRVVVGNGKVDVVGGNVVVEEDVDEGEGIVDVVDAVTVRER